MIKHERERRKRMWEELISSDGPKNVSPTLLRELGMYGGAQGIWVNKNLTSSLTSEGFGVTVGLLHTGSHYPDDLMESGMLYHYPRTNRPSQRDYSEIQATKAASKLSLPIFVITHSNLDSNLRDVFLGWVEDWDDKQGLFLVTFEDEEPKVLLYQPPDETPFVLKEEFSDYSTLTRARPGQQRFSYLVFQRYGEKCAVCDIDVPEVLHAAHLIPWRESGTNDPRNGLVLCATHHVAFDAGLFAINPDSLEICFLDEGPNKDALRITRRDITHLENTPHSDAINWIWELWEQKSGWLNP